MCMLVYILHYIMLQIHLLKRKKKNDVAESLRPAVYLSMARLHIWPEPRGCLLLLRKNKGD